MLSDVTITFQDMQTLQDNTSSIMRKAETHFSSNAQDFHKHTKLAIMTLMPALYSHTFCSLLPFFDPVTLVKVKLDISGIR